ncbi:MAG TPA: TIGR03435 family protein [Bryobacteraceae bacterium]|jgi:uncharacterized protein (TIGR03435 family)
MNPERVLLMTLVAASCGWSQARFDAASVRLAAKDSQAQPCLCEPPGRVAYRSVPMLWILERAFGLQELQMEAPEWAKDLAFDVNAVMPPGASKEQIPFLLRTLLEERFRLQVRREKREVASFVMTALGTGVKMSVPPDGWESGFRNDRAGIHLRQRMNLSDFAGYLSTQLGRPVVNETGLAGMFAIELNFAPENLLARADGGVQLEPPLQTALREQLGLKLELEKRPADILVVERLDQSPGEN